VCGDPRDLARRHRLPGIIAFYQPDPEKIYPVLATFGAGALLMLTAGASLDRLSATRRRDME